MAKRVKWRKRAFVSEKSCANLHKRKAKKLQLFKTRCFIFEIKPWYCLYKVLSFKYFDMPLILMVSVFSFCAISMVII